MSNNSSLSNKYRLYNPNRFNALDGAVCFLTVLIVFTLVPFALKFLLGDILRAINAFDTFAYYVINVAISQSIIFFVAFIYCKIRKVNPFSGGGYKASWDGIHVLMAMMLTVGIMMLFYFTHLQFANFTSKLIPSIGNIEQNLSPFSSLFALIYLAEIAILPAIVEEMMFRGIIMRGLEQFGGLFAVICSSVMFSLMHGNFGQLILQFIGGFAIGGVVYVTKNYLLGSIMHFMNNAFSVVYTMLITPLTDSPISKYVVAVTGSYSIVLGVILCLVGSIYFISMLFEKEKNKALGKSIVNKYEKKRYYLMQEDGVEKFVSYENVPTLYAKNQNDSRLFVIRGRYIRLNRASGKKITFIMTGISIILAIILIFFG